MQQLFSQKMQSVNYFYQIDSMKKNWNIQNKQGYQTKRVLCCFNSNCIGKQIYRQLKNKELSDPEMINLIISKLDSVDCTQFFHVLRCIFWILSRIQQSPSKYRGIQKQLSVQYYQRHISDKIWRCAYNFGYCGMAKIGNKSVMSMSIGEDSPNDFVYEKNLILVSLKMIQSQSNPFNFAKIMTAALNSRKIGKLVFVDSFSLPLLDQNDKKLYFREVRQVSEMDSQVLKHVSLFRRKQIKEVKLKLEYFLLKILQHVYCLACHNHIKQLKFKAKSIKRQKLDSKSEEQYPQFAMTLQIDRIENWKSLCYIKTNSHSPFNQNPLFFVFDEQGIIWKLKECHIYNLSHKIFKLIRKLNDSRVSDQLNKQLADKLFSRIYKQSSQSYQIVQRITKPYESSFLLLIQSQKHHYLVEKLVRHLKNRKILYVDSEVRTNENQPTGASIWYFCADTSFQQIKQVIRTISPRRQTEIQKVSLKLAVKGQCSKNLQKIGSIIQHLKEELYGKSGEQSTKFEIQLIQKKAIIQFQQNYQLSIYSFANLKAMKYCVSFCHDQIKIDECLKRQNTLEFIESDEHE